jgi:hypothetical protein
MGEDRASRGERNVVDWKEILEFWQVVIGREILGFWNSGILGFKKKKNARGSRGCTRIEEKADSGILRCKKLTLRHAHRSPS